MKRRKRISLALVGLLGCCGLLAGAAFATLHSASLLTPLGGAFDSVLRGEIDHLVLRNLKLNFRIDNGPAGTADWSFLGRLPNIRRLEIQNSEALLTFEAGGQHVRLDGLDVTISDFSSKGGGNLSFQTSFAFERRGGAALTARGQIKGTIQVTGVTPRPHGRGVIELSVDSGTYTRGNRTVSLDSLVLATDLTYEQRTETLTINELHGESKTLGSFRASGMAVLRDDMPWRANLALATDVAKLVGVLKPLLPEEYRAWTIQGEGAVETQMRGTLASDRPSLNGAVTLSFTQGGFSSPDGSKAAQGIRTRLVLGLAYVATERKLAITVQGEQRDGEYLWGTYYSNLAGRVATLRTDGALFFGGDKLFALNGHLDVYQTGDYAFQASGTGRQWVVQLRADVSHARFVDTLLKEYFKGVSPAFGSLSLTGSSTLEATVRREAESTAITGIYRMTDAALNAPDMEFSVQEIVAHVPFDLVYPSSAQRVAASPEPGFLRLQTLQRRRLSIEHLEVPLLIAHNRLEIPEPVQVPFFGGRIDLYGVQVDDVLFPTRYRFGVKIQDVDLGRMTRRLAGIEYPGRINADFGMMRYADNRVTSEGRAVVGIFGGEIAATNLFAEDLASSRRFGGDITFRGISLEELTSKIAIGKMTGIIEGSLRNFVMEFGEPASFILELESVETRGVEQSISTDAIESISIAGSGAGSALNRGITQFFKEYPYSKIGLRCVLRNDQFSVNGTIHEGGKEYLVRRGLLRGVDVINQNPDNVISFRDMQERIKRIFTSEPDVNAIRVE